MIEGSCNPQDSRVPLPTYGYRCTACRAEYDRRESFSAPMEHACDVCHAGTAKRVLTAPPVVFKGSGWYVTDSRSKSPTATEGTAGGGKSGESGSTDSPKSETKSDAKTDAKPTATSESSGSGGTKETSTAAS
jgi:putative FmdB family regulatory protein